MPHSVVYILLLNSFFCKILRQKSAVIVEISKEVTGGTF